MIRWPVVRTLIVKELLEVVRDRRSVFLMIVLPLLLYPLIFLATTTVAMHQLEVIEAEPASVASVGAAIPAELRNRIEALDNLTLAKSGGAWAEERLSEGTVQTQHPTRLWARRAPERADRAQSRGLLQSFGVAPYSTILSVCP